MMKKTIIIPWLLLLAQQATAFLPTSNNNNARSTIVEQTQGLCMVKSKNNNNPFSNFSSKMKGETLDPPQPRRTQPVQPRRTVAISPQPPKEDDEESSTSSNSGFGFFKMPNLGFGGKEEEPKMQEYSFDEQAAQTDTDSTNKFGMAQRLESVKCALIGALSGSIAVAPVAYFHYLDSLAQWEFTTDTAALQAALFAIVYRYAIRDDKNPMLNQGVIGAFVVVRTLSNIYVTNTCTALPLQCEYLLSIYMYICSQAIDRSMY
jgi:hypothetical protein